MMGGVMLTCVMCLALAWPHHKKPKVVPVPQIQVNIDPLESAAIGVELDEDLRDLITAHDQYPWLKQWGEPAAVLIDKILNGPPDVNLEDDIEQLRSDMKLLRRLELNDTI